MDAKLRAVERADRLSGQASASGKGYEDTHLWSSAHG